MCIEISWISLFSQVDIQSPDTVYWASPIFGVFIISHIPYPISYPRWMPSPLTPNTGQAPSSGCSSYPGSSATASSASQSQRKGTYMRKDPKFVFICGNYQTRNNWKVQMRKKAKLVFVRGSYQRHWNPECKKTNSPLRILIKVSLSLLDQWDVEIPLFWSQFISHLSLA